jgi:hypothetical protein
MEFYIWNIYQVGINILEFNLISMVLIYFIVFKILIFNFFLWKWVKMLSSRKLNIVFISDSQLIYWCKFPIYH